MLSFLDKLVTNKKGMLSESLQFYPGRNKLLCFASCQPRREENGGKLSFLISPFPLQFESKSNFSRSRDAFRPTTHERKHLMDYNLRISLEHIESRGGFRPRGIFSHVARLDQSRARENI